MTSGEQIALADFVAAVRNHYGDRLHDILVFGSRARGDARTDSDVDLAVIFRDDIADFWHEKLLMADMSYNALIIADLIIQSWPISRAQWEAPETAENPEFVRRIKIDAVELGKAA